MRPADAGTAFAIDDDFAVRRLARRGFRWPWWSAALRKNCFQSVTPSHSSMRLAEFERREKNRTALPYFHVRFLCSTFEIGIPIREVKAGGRPGKTQREFNRSPAISDCSKEGPFSAE